MIMKRGTAAVSLMAVFMLAICFIVLGSISVELMAALNIDAGQFGTLVMSLFLTSCIVELFIGPLVDKIGHKPLAIAGFIITGASMILLALAPGMTMAVIACIALGTGAMSLNTVGNTLIPVVLFEGKDPARASNFGNGFFGIGFILTPLIIVFITKTLGLHYKAALYIIAGLSFLLMVFAVFTDFPKVTTGYRFAMAFRLLLKPAIIVAAAALLCYNALEVTMGTWIKKLMEDLFSVHAGADPAAAAGIVLSLFGVAMMAGRFLMASVRNLTAIGSRVLIVSSAVSLAAILLMMTAKNPVTGIIAVLLAGLAFAPIFPTIVGITFAKFESGLYGSIFGIIFAIGLLGGTFIPKIIGNLSLNFTLQQSLAVAAIFAGLLIILSFIIGKTGKSETGT